MASGTLCFSEAHVARYPIELPTTLKCKHQHTTTPTSRHLAKRIKREHTYSSNDDLETSEVTCVIKLKPLTPASRCRPAPGPPFTAVAYNLRRRLSVRRRCPLPPARGSPPRRCYVSHNLVPPPSLVHRLCTATSIPTLPPINGTALNDTTY
ncbi:hypothetical protein DFH08DRAFT_970421 [Mycena albidolilacea]|uniref:Uncharacterized protein n=1 Tax=Mycena albidolilacea TaxID=1033008 RepID=A0AAD6ZFT8_9AGAR|nr:hypothetical protein DFH08DRAFT_970421 [Mycena albidolilacea]